MIKMEIKMTKILGCFEVSELVLMYFGSDGKKIISKHFALLDDAPTAEEICEFFNPIDDLRIDPLKMFNRIPSNKFNIILIEGLGIHVYMKDEIIDFSIFEVEPVPFNSEGVHFGGPDAEKLNRSNYEKIIEAVELMRSKLLEELKGMYFGRNPVVKSVNIRVEYFTYEENSRGR